MNEKIMLACLLLASVIIGLVGLAILNWTLYKDIREMAKKSES